MYKLKERIVSKVSNLKPIYLLAGGRPQNPKTLNSLLEAVYKESCKASPNIAYVGTANNDNKDFFLRMESILKAAGAARINHAFLCSTIPDLQQAKDILTSADIVYISGGDVDRGMQVLQERQMTSFLFGLYKTGKPFFGLSAGSIMLAKEWIRWNNPNDDASAEIFPCLNIAPVICDTHGEQDNWEELQALLKLKKQNVKGYGIVSGTAIKVFPDGKVEALGDAVHQYIYRREGIVRIDDILPSKT
jgi:peptidase E